jgi:hypothetical protein
MNDHKLRQYVQQKREREDRARQLREERKSQQNNRNRNQSNNHGNTSHSNNRVIGDPFAGADNENTNRSNSMWNKSAGNSHNGRNHGRRHDRNDEQDDGHDAENSNSRRGSYNTPFPAHGSTRSMVNDERRGGNTHNTHQKREHNRERDSGNSGNNDNGFSFNRYDSGNDFDNYGKNAESDNNAIKTPIVSNAYHERRNNSSAVNDGMLSFPSNKDRSRNSRAETFDHQKRNHGHHAKVDASFTSAYADHDRHDRPDRPDANEGRENFNNSWDTPLPNDSYRSNFQSAAKNARQPSVGSKEWASAAEVKRLVSMVQQLRGQLHSLQFQIDNVKYENQKTLEQNKTLQETQDALVEKVSELEIAYADQSYTKSKGRRQSRENELRLSPVPAGDSQSQARGSMHNHNLDNTKHRSRTSNAERDRDSDKQSINFNFGRNGNNVNDRQPRERGFDNDTQSNNSRRHYNDNQNSNRYAQPRGSSAGAPVSSMDIDHNADSNTRSNFGNYGSAVSAVSAFPANSKQSNRNMNASTNSNVRADQHHSQSASHREGMHDNRDGSDGEIAAPPMSTAADLVAKLDKMTGAFEPAQPRVPCEQCGRKFSQTALAKHRRICKKIFGQKRKAFDMKHQRLDDEAMQANANSNEAVYASKLAQKHSEWKNQSGMLREAVRSGKQYTQAIKEGKSTKDIPLMKSNIPDSRVPCPYCGRKFSADAADRHIPKCKNIKAKPTFLKRRR